MNQSRTTTSTPAVTHATPVTAAMHRAVLPNRSWHRQPNGQERHQQKGALGQANECIGLAELQESVEVVPIFYVRAQRYVGWLHP